MKSIELALKRKGNSYYFSNKATDSENELFADKLAGSKLLLELLMEKVITHCNALHLLQQIIEIPDFPICPRTRIDQLSADIMALAIISKSRDHIQKVSLIETTDDLPKLILCKNCGTHGSIYGTDFISSELSNKPQAMDCLEELFGEGKVNREQRISLKQQIEESDLANIDEAKASMLN